MQLTPKLGLHSPQNSDKGSTLFPDLNYNFFKLDDILGQFEETHAGSTFNSTANGRYRKLLTLPAVKTFDKTVIKVFTQETPAQLIYPKIEKFSDSQCYLYLPANNIDVRVIYV